MYQNRKPAAAGCFTNPYGNISLICVVGTKNMLKGSAIMSEIEKITMNGLPTIG